MPFQRRIPGKPAQPTGEMGDMLCKEWLEDERKGDVIEINFSGNLLRVLSRDECEERAKKVG